MTNFLNFVR